MGSFDFQAMRDAIEMRDANTLKSMYSDSATIEVVDKVATPSAPNTLHGRDPIDEYLSDICGREMSHQVGNEIIGDSRVSFTEACRYPDGTRVLSANVLDVTDGKIDRHLVLQAWDE